MGARRSGLRTRLVLGGGGALCHSVAMKLSRPFFDRLGEAARTALADLGDVRSGYANKAAAGFDPVTAVDRAIEQALRALIGEHFPDDAIRGEEFGWTAQGAPRTWSIDPIDGTRAFICGLPSWATLVGVVEDDAACRGDDRPADARRAADRDRRRRRGATGAPSRRADAPSSQSARLSTTDPFLFAGAEPNCSSACAERRWWRATASTRWPMRGSRPATSTWSSRAACSAMISTRWSRWCAAPAVAIGDWEGGEDWDRGRIIAAATRALYDEAVALLSA